MSFLGSLDQDKLNNEYLFKPMRWKYSRKFLFTAAALNGLLCMHY